MKALYTLIFALLVTVLPLASKSETITFKDLVIENPWVRESTSIKRPTAAYMVIKNNGSEDDTLVRIEAEVSGKPEIHRTTINDGVMSMSPVSGITIPANGSAVLKPGGFHLMLMKLTRPVKEKDMVKIKLFFEKAGMLEIAAPTKKLTSTK